METALFEFLAAATGAGIVPPDLAARSNQLRQPCEKVDPWGWRGPAVTNAHQNLHIFNIAKYGKVNAFHGVSYPDQVDGLNRAEVDEAPDQEGVQDRPMAGSFESSLRSVSRSMRQVHGWSDPDW